MEYEDKQEAGEALLVDLDGVPYMSFPEFLSLHAAVHHEKAKKKKILYKWKRRAGLVPEKGNLPMDWAMYLSGQDCRRAEWGASGILYEMP